MATPAGRRAVSLLTESRMTERVRTELRYEPASVSVARRFGCEALESWGFPASGGLTDRVVLAVSELVTNAVVHGGPPRDSTDLRLGLTIAFRPGVALGIQVTDSSPMAPVTAGCPPASCPGGRGLFLVEHVADHWSVTPSRQETVGKSVWAIFLCPAASGLLRSA